MIVLNFAHPITPQQHADAERLCGREIDRVIPVRADFDHSRPFAEQAHELVNSAGLEPDEWQSVPLLVNLPSFSPIASLVLAVLHGRCGYFPAAIRMRPIPGASPPQFEVAEILNLQLVRDASRTDR